MTGRANNRKTGFNENMNSRTVALSLLIAMAALLVSLPWLRGEEPAEPSFDTDDVGVPHAECTFFTAKAGTLSAGRARRGFAGDDPPR